MNDPFKAIIGTAAIVIMLCQVSSCVSQKSQAESLLKLAYGGTQ